MKALPVLVVVQLVLVAFLAAKLMTLERAIGATASSAVASATRCDVTNDSVTRAEAMPAQDSWEARLRQIVREEISAVAQPGMAPTLPESSYTRAAPVSPPPDPQRLTAVSRQLDYFIDIGSISPSEMAVLQGDIARLDDAGRRQMLGKLIRAINTGSLKGEL